MTSIEEAVGQKLLIAFDGMEKPSKDFFHSLRQYRPAGVTLFRSRNIQNPQQARSLTATLQEAARLEGMPPLLIGADQEGGQLMAVGEGVTPLPGNLALGSTGSEALARQAGEVLGVELAAMGINVDFAPCCDVNSNPNNPVIGTRSFGEDPRMVGKMAYAMIEGIQNMGVAATAKHFPGHGDTTNDSHHGIPIVAHAMERLEQIEFPPFISAVKAGPKLMMSAHVALPALTGREDLPATLSPEILTALLREGMGFRGVIVTDAMDMKAIRQGEAFGVEAVYAAQAGADLLLITANPEDHRRAYEGIVSAVRSGQLSPQTLRQSAERVLAMKAWLSAQTPQPEISVVGCAAHRMVAENIASQSITLVRDHASLLPLRLSETQRLVVILPRPVDLTPADTSSYVVPSLAKNIRLYHPRTEEIIVSHAPVDEDIREVLERIRSADMVVIGTLNAFAQPAQAAMVNAVLTAGIPAVVAALRMPYDLTAFPQAPTYLCSYSILEPSMSALTRVLFGQSPAYGRLPVSIPDLYALGYSA